MVNASPISYETRQETTIYEKATYTGHASHRLRLC